MKWSLALLCFCLNLMPCLAFKSNDSIWIRGVVRPDNSRYPFKILKNVSVSLLKQDQSIGKTFSDDSGKFQLRCSLKDLKRPLQLLFEARAAQPVVTYDSVCPYIVNKTSDRYFDRYVDVRKDMLLGNEIYKEVYMSPPLLYANNCMAFKLDENCVAALPCLSKNKDTMCMCIGNSYERLTLIDQKLLPTVWIRSYYIDNADSARIRAEKVMDLLIKDYKIADKHIKILPVYWSENGKFEDLYTPRCNYVVVNIMIEKIMSEKDR